jgi:methyl-accepting chemotaxis protein
MFKNLSLRIKMLAAFSSIAFCLLIVGGVAYVGLEGVISQYDHVVEVNFENAVALGKVRASQKDVIIAISLLLGSHASADDLKNSQSKLTAAFKDFEEAAKTYEASPWAPGEEAKWDEVKKKWLPFKELSEKLIMLSSTGKKEDEATRDQLGSREFISLQNELLLGTNEIVRFQRDDSKIWTEKAARAAALAKTLTVSLVIGGFILSQLIGLLFSAGISKRLSSLASRMLESAQSVASSSTQVSSAGTELSSSTTEQATALQESVASIDQVNAMIQKNAENASRSKHAASTGQESAVKGKQAVETMIDSIDQINTSNQEIMKQIDESNRQISQIVDMISEIGSKTKIINDIVFQTKLLSFNASVEAARAGEHGKGFAVVAEEVGNLAQMSGKAAHEISSLLDESIQKVNAIVNEMKGRVESLVSIGKARVETGMETARRCGEVLDEIVKNVSSVSQMVSEISIASNEQAQGVQEINKAMTQMDEVTQQNSSASHQVAQAAEHLSLQAQELRGYVRGLYEVVNGTNEQTDGTVDSIGPIGTQVSSNST